MAIKWEDVDVMVTALSNEIRLCKAKPVKGGEPGAMFATDMSGDKTEKCVKAVMQYMLNCCREEKAYAKIFTIPDVCRLELTDLATAPKEQELFTLDQVAGLLYAAFGDSCPCNFNGNDEWLPMVCRFCESGDCPDPADKLDCWREYIRQQDKRTKEDKNESET